MQLLIIPPLLIPLVYNIVFATEALSRKSFANVFEGLGNSSVCIASALTACECSSDLNCIVWANELATFIRVLKSGNIPATDNLNNIASSLIETLNKVKDIDEFYIKGAEGFSMMKTFLQDAKDSTTCAKDNSQSVYKFLEEFKIILLDKSKNSADSLEEIKREQGNDFRFINDSLTLVKTAIQHNSQPTTDLKNANGSFAGVKTILRDSLQGVTESLIEVKENIADNYKNIAISFTAAETNIQNNSADFILHLKTGFKESITEITKTLQKDNKIIIDILQDMKKSLGGLQTKHKLNQACEEHLKRFNKSSNCAGLKKQGDLTSGVRCIYPNGPLENEVVVYCDQTTDEGGWTVFQNRDALPVRENFSRNWNDYVYGFGDVNGEFWLGLDNIHALTISTPMELRVDLEDYADKVRYAKYRTFNIGDASTKYTLTISNYSGDADDSFNSNGMKFTTKDRDYDGNPANCAISYQGAWWYTGNCGYSNLNGHYYAGAPSPRGKGIIWHGFRDFAYSLKKASMKVRPISY